MSNSERLRKQREGTVINELSKKQDKKLQEIVVAVETILKGRFPDFKFILHKTWFLKDIVADLNKHFPEVEFYCEHKKSSMRPDGGILALEASNGETYPILISERKNQGTNARRLKEGKTKQARGNAIERLGKNVIGFRTALLNENIFPFVCFGDGCDFAPDSTIVDRVGTIAMFSRLNKINLHTEKGVFNRGSFYFREKQWNNKEMFDVCLEIATGSIHYYISKYTEEHFNH